MKPKTENNGENGGGLLSATDAEPVKPDLLNQVYHRPRARRPMDRIRLRSDQLLALAAELDVAVCDEKPAADLREFIAAMEYLAAEIQAVCVRHEIHRQALKAN